MSENILIKIKLLSILVNSYACSVIKQRVENLGITLPTQKENRLYISSSILYSVINENCNNNDNNNIHKQNKHFNYRPT